MNPPDPTQAAHRAKILLVDDQPANLLALEAILRDLGAIMVKVNSGDEALRRLLDDDFAVILLDVQMHGLDGFETAQLIRGRDKSRHTPIIFLTAYETNRFTVVQAYRLGAVDYLVKPLVPEILRAKVAGFVELFLKRLELGLTNEALRVEIAERQRAEEALRASEERFRLLVEGTRDHALFLLDPGGHVVSWNAGAERINGYRADEIIGRHFSCFYPPEDVLAGKPEAELKQVAEQGKAEDEGWRVRQDGSRYWANTVLTALRAPDGRLRGFSKITRDVTAKKEAEENARRLLQEQAARKAAEEGEARFRRLAESNIIGVSFSDVDGRISYANDAFLQIVGRSRYEVGQGAVRWPDLTAPDGPTWVGQAIEPLRRGEVSAPFEKEVRRRDGTPAPVLLGAAFLDDSQRELVCFMVDLSQQKRLEQELRQRAEELAEADRRKDEFLALLAHELRNPLAPIRNALHIMKQPGVAAAVVGQVRDMMERQLRHMTRMIDDLLDVSRITRGKIELRREVVDLTVAARHVLETVRPLMEENRHELTVALPEQPLRLEADPTRLEQILFNLLTNAARYTEPGGRIWLTAQSADGGVEVRVRDTGTGIDPKILPHIFEPFVQGTRRLDRSRGGLGIGLTLVRRLVELHGGTVQAVSAGPGQGSEFIVRLPGAQKTTRPGPNGFGREERPPGSAPGRRILVVDDNLDVGDSLVLLLRQHGHEVRVANDGPTALALAREERPDVVLLDIGMPGMDGYEVARRLRQEPGLQGVLLVAMTGFGQETDRRHSRAAGFDQHLVKPVEPDDLLRLLAQPRPAPAAPGPP
jgi:PAS domain S-box-containing protein